MTKIDQMRAELGRRNFQDFVELTFPKYTFTDFHKVYTYIIDKFAKGEITKLIVSVPPQHGKSVISSQWLPAYILGKNHNAEVVIASYAQSLARRFGRKIKQLMATDSYKAIFGRQIITSKDTGKINNADVMEIAGGTGSLSLVGRKSGLTGNPVDILIIDDLYKDAMEANSPVVRAAAIEWYQTVAESRIHNDSKQLIVFTRWHQEDLIGWLEEKGLVIEVTSLEQLKNIDKTKWIKINFQALKDNEKTAFDKREKGEALYPQRHSKDRLEAKRKQDKEVFGSLYQGDPRPSEGLLFTGFETYRELPSIVSKRVMYVDVADTGKDKLCAISASIVDNKAYVTDVLYTVEPGEVTEPLTYGMIRDGYIDTVWVESNAGGRGFARNVEVLCREDNVRVSMRPFHQSQSQNKEARIITGASAAQRHVIFPYLWEKKWPAFYKDLMNFKKLFKANAHDDAPDTVTGLVEKNIKISGSIGAYFK